MNKQKFYDSIRPSLNLTTQNVVGLEKVLDYAIQRKTPINDLAYILATAWWESAQTMHPVVEAYWLSEAWRKKNLRYYPWHGRGLIQTTWEDNYIKMGKEIGVDLTDDPDLLLEWEYALPALFVGMEKGLYTGKDLDVYIDDIDESDAEDLKEYVGARRIVNGTDKATQIGKIALTFEKGLKAGGYNTNTPVIETSEPSVGLFELLSMGSNDWATPEVVRKPLEKALENSINRGRTPIVILPNPNGAKTQGVSKVVKEVAESKGVPLYHIKQWEKDGVHPKSSEYKQLAILYDGQIVRGDSLAVGVIMHQKRRNPLSWSLEGKNSSYILEQIKKKDGSLLVSPVQTIPDVPKVEVPEKTEAPVGGFMSVLTLLILKLLGGK
jgi:predicted chitinase